MEGLERSKASLSSKLAVAQEEAAHMKAELGDHSSQAAKLKAQLHSIHDAHSKVSCAIIVPLQGPGLLCTFSCRGQGCCAPFPAGARAVVHCSNCAVGLPCCHFACSLS